VSVVDQQRVSQSHIEQNWRRPASICISLALLGALLGGAMWLQSGKSSRQNTENFPTPVPPVPLRFGFYDLQRRAVDDDPVLAAMSKEKLDFLVLQNVVDLQIKDAQKRSGFWGPGTYEFPDPGFPHAMDIEEPTYDCVFSRYPLTALPDVQSAGQLTVVSSTVAGREFCLLCGVFSPEILAPVTDSRISKRATIEMIAQRLPTVACLLTSANDLESGLVKSSTGWFDGGAVFWRLPISTGEMPPANHLFFSTGWSCRGGEVVRDMNDPLHRIGWIVTTAGAASPATHPAGDGDD
jgi:hypothetical protein